MSRDTEKMTMRMRLGTKAALAAISLLVAVSASLTVFLVTYQKRSSMNQLRERSLSLASNLAYNSNYAVLARDLETLRNLVRGVRREKDIVEAMIVDMRGRLIVSAGGAAGPDEDIALETLTAGQRQFWLADRQRDICHAVNLIAMEEEEQRDDEEFLFSPMADPPTDGPDSVLFSSHVQPLGYVVLDVSLERMNRELAGSIRRALLVTTLMILAGVLLVFFSVRRIVQPVFMLASATRDIAKGYFGRTIPVDSRDELGVLADSFNRMSRQLKDSRDNVETLNRELEERVAESTAELKNRYQELEKTFAELKSLNSAKDDFLSLITHEFRTPLGSIQLFSEMLLKGIDSTDTRRADFLATIIKNCRRLSRLINDILDISRIEAGQMQFDFRQFDLQAAAEETLFSLKPLLERHRMICRCTFSDGAINIVSDRDRVVQVLTNILTNAIKFSPDKGTIVIEITRKAGEVVISVRDSGKGIRPEDIPKVFDMYSQFENIREKSLGSGLGMTISRLIVEHLGGKIWLFSKPGQGTTVHFTLPLVPEESNGDREEESPES